MHGLAFSRSIILAAFLVPEANHPNLQDQFRGPVFAGDDVLDDGVKQNRLQDGDLVGVVLRLVQPAQEVGAEYQDLLFTHLKFISL